MLAEIESKMVIKMSRHEFFELLTETIVGVADLNPNTLLSLSVNEKSEVCIVIARRGHAEEVRS